MRDDYDVNYSLICAVREGDLERTKKLINSFGLSYSKGWSEGYVLLLDALLYRKIEIAKLLLNHGCKVNSKNNMSCDRPLHLAAASSDTEVVEMILDKGARINAVNKRGETPLHCAIKNSDINVEVTKLLLKHGSNVNVRTIIGTTPLHYAAEKGIIEAVQLLLDSGANVDAKAEDSNTPLHIAVLRRQETVVELLLRYGAKVDNRDKNGKTALRLAVENGYASLLPTIQNILKYSPDINNQSNRESLKIAVLGHVPSWRKEVVEALLEYGFSVIPEDANNTELFRSAVEKGYVKIVDDFLKYGANVNTLFGPSRNGKGLTPLHIAVINKQEEMANLLISNEADINARDENGKIPIFFAVKNNDLNLTKFLLAYKANLKYSPEVLFKAVKTKCIEILEVLLRYDVDVNATDKYGRTALHLVLQDNRFADVRKYKNPEVKDAIAKLLLNRGADVDAQTVEGETALHFAIQSENLKVVKTILEYNANVNLGTKKGYMPLCLSSLKGNVEICTLLLNKGANVNVKKNGGISALHIATQKNHGNIVKLLLKYGADVDAQTIKGKTALHFASLIGSVEICTLLLNKGANVNVKKNGGISALHIAAKNHHGNIVKLLLKYGARVNSQDNDGRNALHYACYNGHEEAVEELLEHGSDINITSKNGCTALDDNAAGSFYIESNSYDSDASDYYDTDRAAFGREITLTLYKANSLIVKMKTANLYVSEKNIQSMSTVSDDIRKIQDQYLRELARMRKEKIVNSNISIFDILVKGASSLAAYMRNENVVEVSKTASYETQFPSYASILKSQFRKGMQRNKLLEPANRCLSSLFSGYPKLPFECAEKILNYTSNEDLENLIDAFEPDCIS